MNEKRTQPAEVTDEQILEVFRQHWDPLKFARAILALRPLQVPMADEAKQRGSMYWAPEYRGAFAAGIAWCEAHHGITAQAKKEDGK